MNEIAEKNTRKLTPADRRKLARELAMGERKRSQLARDYGVSAAYITKFAKERMAEIDAIRRDLDNQFAGLWIADKEQRLAAYAADYDLSAEGDFSAHYEQIRTRSAILRNVAEELGQLPNRSTAAIIVPVVHVLENVDTELLKLKAGVQAAKRPGPVRNRGVFVPLRARGRGGADGPCRARQPGVYGGVLPWQFVITGALDRLAAFRADQIGHDQRSSRASRSASASRTAGESAVM